MSEEQKDIELGELTPQTTITIEDGKHSAKIVDVKRKLVKEKYDYTDYFFELDGKDGTTIKYGVPTEIKINQDGEPTNKHTKLLKALGFDVTKTVKPLEAIGKKVNLMTINETTDNGTFARVVEGSVKLA